MKDFKFFVSHLAGMDAGASDAYWRKAFKDSESEPFPRPVVTPSSIPGSTAKYRCLLLPTKDPDVTVASMIRAAWALTAAGSSGVASIDDSADVVFGATVTGLSADMMGIEEIAGPTIATVPVRVRMSAEQTVRAFLRQVQAQSIDMISYEQAGLQRIQSTSSEAYQACQFQTLLVIQASEDHEMNGASEAAGAFGTWHTDIQVSASSYGLNVVCLLQDHSIEIEADFDSEWIEQRAMTSLLERFERVMRQLAMSEEDRKLADIDILAKTDLQRLWSWNASVPPAVDLCIHTLVEEQARVMPDATAVYAWDGELSYKGSHSTFMLREVGLGQATDRREEVIRQTAASVVLTSMTNETLVSRPGRTIIIVGFHTVDNLPEGSAETALPEDDPTTAAYFASYAFDASIMEIFTTLIAGGSISIASGNNRLEDIEEAITAIGAVVLSLAVAAVIVLVGQLVRPRRSLYTRPEVPPPEWYGDVLPNANVDI
ncbi:putative HC-toxin synthetase [Colletotrichum sublineola]|uniref:Putative HC-toxin synthetase n=1 Tax=Colletotrichum sublineola TaxID=1173701 RepID=A0A066XDB5_COLSU|nr:putative HC-toxin synthetase [Colletotrichum sublineola]